MSQGTRNLHSLANATLCLVLIGSCTPSELLESGGKAPEGLYARAVLDDLARGDANPVRSRLVPEAHTPDLDANMAKLLEQIPKARPSRVRLVGYRSNHIIGGPTRYLLTFESFYPQGNLLTGVTIRSADDGNGFRLEGVNVQKLAAPLDVMNAFTLRGKSRLHYVFLALALLALGITATAMVAWARAGRIPRRWLWMAAILLGLGKIGVQWTTGALIAQPLSLQLFSVAAVKEGPFGPWLFSVSIPFGAIAFLIVRPRAVVRPEPEGAPAP